MRCLTLTLFGIAFAFCSPTSAESFRDRVAGWVGKTSTHAEQKDAGTPAAIPRRSWRQNLSAHLPALPAISMPAMPWSERPPAPEIPKQLAAPRESDEPEKTFVLAGGFRSCESHWERAWYFRLKPLAEKELSRSGLRSKFILVCFTGSVRHPSTPELLKYQIVSFDPGRRAFVVSAEGEIAPAKEKEKLFHEFLEIVQQSTKPAEKHPMSLIGHSHGGWLVMKLAQDLPAAYPIRYLATIDPISAALCDPLGYRDELIHGHLMSGHHTRAPQEFDVAAIVARLPPESFDNFFQNSALLMNSGEIEGAQNLDLYKRWPRLPLAWSHRKIIHKEQMWDRITNRVEADLREAGNTRQDEEPAAPDRSPARGTPPAPILPPASRVN